MSLIPEFIFQTTISRGIDLLRTDPRYIDQLFRNLSQGDQQQMRSFIQQHQIDLSINYPRSQLSVPAIVVLLKSDNESSQGAYLNDFMGYDTPDEFSYDGPIENEVLGGTASTTQIHGPGEVIFGPSRVLSATNNTLSVTNGEIYTNQFTDGRVRNRIYIVAGTGKGQQREVVSNSSSAIMVDSNWDTNPDNTSIFEIREPAREVLGEPSKLYDRRDPSTVVERKGSLYTNKYQIQLVGGNQEQTIYLYAILKSIFTLSRVFMEGQGVINLRMSGSDFVNRPEYIPDFAYMRVLNVEFEHPFDVYEPAKGLIEDFTLCLNNGSDVPLGISTEPVEIGRPDPEVVGP